MSDHSLTIIIVFAIISVLATSFIAITITDWIDGTSTPIEILADGTGHGFFDDRASGEKK